MSLGPFFNRIIVWIEQSVIKMFIFAIDWRLVILFFMSLPPPLFLITFPSLSLSFKVNFNLHESLIFFISIVSVSFFSYSFLFHILSFRHFESTTGMLSSHFFSFPYRLITLPYLNSLMSVDWKQTKKNIQTNGDIVIDVSRLSRR